MPGGTILRRPYNWNPVCVEIASLDLVRSKIDPVFRTAKPQKRRTIRYVYNAQVNLGSKTQDRSSPTERGDRPFTMGHLVMRTMDLAPNSDLPIPQHGWQITKLYVDTDMELAVDYVIEEVRFESPLRGRPLLVYVEFEDHKERTHKFTNG